MTQATSTPTVPPTLTAYETARVMNVVPATIYTWIRNDDIPHLRLGGRIRIPTAKLADLLGLTAEDLTRAL